MSKVHSVRGVELPEGASGSSFLYELLKHAVDSEPEIFADVGLPKSAKLFKDGFGSALARFEAIRAASDKRVEIALSMRKLAASRLRFVDDRGERSFADAMLEPATSLPTTRIQTKGPGRLSPSVSSRGATYTGATLRAWIVGARQERVITEACEAALVRLLDRADREGGTLSRTGERFALLGAGAELAPTELLLAAGAEVLWIDLRAPSQALLDNPNLGGTLHVPDGGANLLEAPAAIAATLKAFAEAGPIHVGMYAYAGGESQEWRLTASMNGIVRSMPPGVVKSLSLLISPTTAMVVSPRDAEVAEERRVAGSTFRKLLAKAGVLVQGQIPSGTGRVSCSVVPLQGASYQAAQYIGKILSAETHAVYGASLLDTNHPLTISANVAPITATRSLAHPVFEAGFLGAPMWGIFISEPRTTRELNGLLAIHDVTDPAAPGAASQVYASAADRARALFLEQAHGGVFAQPYALDGGIKVAAVSGLMQKPSLIPRLFG